MFKKLKDKITEDIKQNPIRLPTSVQQLSQQISALSRESLGISEVKRAPSSQSQFSIAEEDSHDASGQQFQTVSLLDMDQPGSSSTLTSTPVPRRNRRNSQGSVSSMDRDYSVFGSSLYDSSYTPYQFQSDMESVFSELSESTGTYSSVSKEQLVHALQRAKARYHKYKGRYQDLSGYHKDLEKEREKLKNVLTETQDKALKRISDLKEQCQLEQKAKAHLEENLRADLEEKDHVISVLQSKIKLLQSKSRETSQDNLLVDLVPTSDLDISTPPDSTPREQELHERLRRYEDLLSKCKEKIKSDKDKVDQMRKDLEAASQRAREVESEMQKAKESHSNELRELMDSLNVAREEILAVRKREEGAMLASAETKQQVHSELLKSEEEMQRLKNKLSMTLTEKETLQGKVSTLEKNLASQKTELSKKIKDLTAELKSSSAKAEEDKRRVMEELSRGKSEAIKIMKEELDRDAEARWGAVLKERMHDAEMKYKSETKQLEEAWSQRFREAEEAKKLGMEAHEMECAAKVIQEQEGHAELQIQISDFKSKILELEAAQTATKQDWDKAKAEWVNSIEGNRKRHLEEIAALETKHETDVEVQLANKDSSLAMTLEQVADKHRKEMDNLQQQLDNALESSVTAIEVHRCEVESINTEYEQLLRQKDQEIEKLNAELSTSISKLKDLSAQLEILQKSVSERDEKISSLVDELAGVRAFSQSGQTELSDELRSLALKLEEAETLACERKVRESQLEKELSKLRKQLNSLQESSQLTQSELNGKLDSVTEKLKEADSLISEKEGRVSEFEAELSATRQSLKSLQESSQSINLELTDKLNSVTKQLENSQNLVAKKDSRVAELERELSDVLKRLTSESERVAKKEEEVEDLSSKLSQLQMKLENAVSGAREELERATTELLSKIETQECEIKSLKIQLDEQIQLSKELQTQLTNEKKKRSETDEERIKLSNEVESLQSKVSSEETNKRSLKVDVKDLQEKLESKQKALDDVEAKLEKVKDSLRTSLQDISELTSKMTNQAHELETSKKNVDNLENMLSSKSLGMQEIHEQLKSSYEEKLGAENAAKEELMAQVESLKKESSKAGMLQEVNRKLQERLKEKEKDLKTSLTTKTLLDQEAKEAMKDLDSVRKELNRKESQFTSLQGKLSAADQEKIELKKKLVAAQDQLKDLEPQLGEVRKVLDMTKAEKEGLVKKLESEKAAADQLKQKLCCSQDSEADLTEKTKQLQEHLNGKVEENKTLSDVVEALRAELQEVKNSLCVAQADKDALESKLAEVRLTVGKLEVAEISMVESISSYKFEISQLSTEKSQIESSLREQLTVSQQRLESSCSVLKERDDQLTLLSETCSASEEREASLLAKIEASERQIESVHAQLNGVQKSRDDLAIQLSVARSAMEGQNDLLAAKESEVSALTTKLEELKDQICSSAENAKLLQEQNEATRQEMSSIKNSLEGEKNALETQLTSTKAELNASCRRDESLCENLEAMQKKFEELEKELAEKKTIKSQLTEELHLTKESLAVSQRELKFLMDKMEAVTSECTIAKSESSSLSQMMGLLEEKLMAVKTNLAEREEQCVEVKLKLETAETNEKTSSEVIGSLKAELEALKLVGAERSVTQEKFNKLKKLFKERSESLDVATKELEKLQLDFQEKLSDLAKSLAESQDDNTSLRNTIDSKTKALEELSALSIETESRFQEAMLKTKDLESQISELNSALAKSDAKQKDMEEEHLKSDMILRKSVDDLKLELSRINEKKGEAINGLKEGIGRLEAQNEELLGELARKEEQRSTFENELKEVKRIDESALKEKDDLIAEKDSLAARLQKEMDISKGELEASRVAATLLEDMLRNKDNEVKSQYENIGKLTKELSTLQEEYKIADRVLLSTRDKLKTFEELERKTLGLEAAAKTKESLLRDLKENVHFLEGKLKNAENISNASNDRVKSSETELDTWKKKVEGLERSLKSLEVEKTRLSSELTETKAKGEELELRLTSVLNLETTNLSLTSDLSSLKVEIETLAADKQQLTTELEAFEATLDQEREANSEKLGSMNKELEAKEVEIQGLGKSLKEAKLKLKDIESLKGMVRQLEAKLASKDENNTISVEEPVRAENVKIIQSSRNSELLEELQHLADAKAQLERKLALLDVQHREEIDELRRELKKGREMEDILLNSNGKINLNGSELTGYPTKGGEDNTHPDREEIDNLKHKHKLEIKELQRLLESFQRRSRARPYDNQPMEEAVELEYLRNILYDYMMGKEPMVLAKVLAAVVKFSKDQTRSIMEREAQKSSLLVQIGIR